MLQSLSETVYEGPWKKHWVGLAIKKKTSKKFDTLTRLLLTNTTSFIYSTERIFSRVGICLSK